MSKNKKCIKLMDEYMEMRKLSAELGCPWVAAIYPPNDPRPVEVRYPDVIDLKAYYVESEKQWYLWGPIVIQPIEIPAPISWRNIPPVPHNPILRIFSVPDGWNSAIEPPDDNRRVSVMQDNKSEGEGFYSSEIGWYVNTTETVTRWVVAWREILKPRM